MKLGRASVLRLGLLALGLFVVGTNAFVIAGLLPQIAHTLGVGPGTVGYSISIYAAVVAVASPLVSVTCSRFAPERVMATGLVLIAAGTFLAAAAHNFPVFTAGRVVAAFGGGDLAGAGRDSGRAQDHGECFRDGHASPPRSGVGRDLLTVARCCRR